MVTAYVRIQKTSPEARVGMQLQPDSDGTTVVDNLAEGGLAAEAGMRVGDTVVVINGTPVTDYEQGAQLVISAESSVVIQVHRPSVAVDADSAASPPPAPSASAGPTDALGSEATLESLGVDLSSVLPRPGVIDLEQVAEASVPAVLLNAEGTNAQAMRCRFCGCAILPAARVTLEPELKLSLPPLPRARSSAEAGEGSRGPEEVTGFWRARDKFDFDNVAVTKPAGEGGLRFLVCAECDAGPYGWFIDETVGETLGNGVDFYVAVDRVQYV